MFFNSGYQSRLLTGKRENRFGVIKATSDNILNENIHLTIVRRWRRNSQLTLRLNCELFINIL